MILLNLCLAISDDSHIIVLETESEKDPKYTKVFDGSNSDFSDQEYLDFYFNKVIVCAPHENTLRIMTKKQSMWEALISDDD